MRILFLSKNMEKYNSASYQHEFYAELQRHTDVIPWGPGFAGYDPHQSLDELIKKYSITDIFVGHSWLPDEIGNYIDGAINLHSFTECEINKFAFLNKEYTRLQEKLDFFKKGRFTHIFTHHHDIENYFHHTQIPFTFVPFASVPSLESSLPEKSIDIFFSGLLRNTNIIASTDIRERIQKKLFYTAYDFSLFRRFKYRNTKIVWINYTFSPIGKLLSRFFNRKERLTSDEYQKMLNLSKAIINTFSPMNLIGTRYYETMAHKAIVLCESGNYHNIFRDMDNCIMFNKDLSDFHDKLLFSISDSTERTKIISNAYDDFMENHTWYHRVSKILTIMEDYHG